MDEIELARFMRETFQDLGLMVAEPKAAERLGLPADAEHFLVNVGLPCGRPFEIDFGPVISLPTLSEFLDANGLSAVIDDPAVLPSPVIGNAYGLLYLMDVRQNLNVIRFDPEGGEVQTDVCEQQCLVVRCVIGRISAVYPKARYARRSPGAGAAP